mmetsp:Transcript_71001/g.148019  ORF Transcript_71001/g.148019 Transcript_71001/m.148019 type:complete len:209 (+) Transcript_71001:1009-1635(+)
MNGQCRALRGRPSSSTPSRNRRVLHPTRHRHGPRPCTLWEWRPRLSSRSNPRRPWAPAVKLQSMLSHTPLQGRHRILLPQLGCQVLGQSWGHDPRSQEGEQHEEEEEEQEAEEEKERAEEEEEHAEEEEEEHEEGKDEDEEVRRRFPRQKQRPCRRHSREARFPNHGNEMSVFASSMIVVVFLGNNRLRNNRTSKGCFLVNNRNKVPG